jgi:acyl carrier protein
MTFDAILADVTRIIRDVLDNEEIQVTAATSAKDVPEWDSLTNVELVVAIERFFKIRFASGEIQKFKNVGEMCAAIERRVSGA